MSEEAAVPRAGGLSVFDAWARATAIGWQSLARLAALSDPRPLRTMWLADLRELSAEALRSPAFLALMKFNLSFLTRRPEPPSAP